MAKKILLVSGCSYTDKNYKSFDPDVKVDWPMWPDLLANYLDLKCVNYGKSGVGCDTICDSIIEGIETYKDRVDTVAILWSGSDRIPIFSHTLNPLVEIRYRDELGPDPFAWLTDIGWGRLSKIYFNSPHFLRDRVYKDMIHAQLRKMSTIIKLCKYHDIKLVMAQGLWFFDHHAVNQAVKEKNIPESCAINFAEVFKCMTDNPYFEHLEKNKKNIIGWPFYPNLGGYSLDAIRFSDKVPVDHYTISEIDKHPNAIGQKMFAEEFINRYDLLYSV
jgi:hypothetical protein